MCVIVRTMFLEHIHRYHCTVCTILYARTHHTHTELYGVYLSKCYITLAFNTTTLIVPGSEQYLQKSFDFNI